MLFQAVVIFLPILNFFKFHVKGERSIVYILSRHSTDIVNINFSITFFAEKFSGIRKNENSDHSSSYLSVYILVSGLLYNFPTQRAYWYMDLHK